MIAKLSIVGIAAGLLGAIGVMNQPHQTPASGDYVEIRSCDVYTGHCFANAETGLTGNEAIMTWAIRKGEFEGVSLENLNVIAVVRAEDTLGDVKRFPQPARSVLIVDERASSAQRDALVRFAQKQAGSVLGEMVRVDAAPMNVELKASCSDGGCARVRAGDLVEIQTRCMGGKDHVCGNEELYYPP